MSKQLLHSDLATGQTAVLQNQWVYLACGCPLDSRGLSVKNVPEQMQVSIHNQWSYAKKIKHSFDFEKGNCNVFRTDPAAHFINTLKVMITQMLTTSSRIWFSEVVLERTVVGSLLRSYLNRSHCYRWVHVTIKEISCVNILSSLTYKGKVNRKPKLYVERSKIMENKAVRLRLWSSVVTVSAALTY